MFGRRALEPPARGACTLHEYRACGLCDAAGGIFAGWRARFFEAPLSHEPGTFFAYNTAASYLAAELVRRAAGRTVPELLARTVFPALGVEEFSWLTCADGRCQGGTGLQASCDDVAKLALLYLNEGEWAGRRVLPRDWVHMAAQPHSVNAGNGTPDWCAGYGYQFWMNRRGGFAATAPLGSCVWFCLKTELRPPLRPSAQI